MKYGLLIFSALLLLRFDSFSQGTWTWVNGTTGINPLGSFGTQGVESAGNTPPGLYEACQWTDTAGNFWLFGGYENANNLNIYWGDLWKFNPLTGYWTWVRGLGVANPTPVFGTMGMPSVENIPPPLSAGTFTWVDHNGDLWLYGGAYLGLSSAMWRYNIASNMWTWMQGQDTASTPPSHGALGVELPTNTPGGRNECAATWVDSSGYLWMYGGVVSLPGGHIGGGGDLWRYNTATNNWAWMGGSTNTNPVYGVMGTPAANNSPGSRWVYSSWIDAGNNFWMFGGYGEFGPYNDVWRYQTATGTWTWMSGTSTINSTGNVTYSCTSDTGFAPGARYENRTSWTGECGNFFFYGGANGNELAYNDLWCFNAYTLQWTLVNGGAGATNAAPVYGAMGVASPTYTPGGRAGALSWRSKTGELYLFGGGLYGTLTPVNTYNDIWKFDIDSTCGNIAVGASVTVAADGPTTFCPGDSALICAPAGYSTYSWNIVSSDSCIYATEPGDYFVSVTDNSGCPATSNHISVNVYTTPSVSITVTGDTLHAYNALSYQWYLNDTLLPGQTDSIFVARQPGIYTVAITDTNGCGAVSNGQDITAIYNVQDIMGLKLYPDPATDALNISYFLNKSANLQITISDLTGRTVANVLNEKETAGNYLQHFNISQWASGTYILNLTSENGNVNLRFVKL